MKEKPTVGSSFSGHFLPTAFLRRRKMLAYVSLFTAGIPVNYGNEFRELFEATTFSTACGIILRIYYMLSIIWDEIDEEGTALL